MSSPSHDQWLQFYQQNRADNPNISPTVNFHGQTSDATTITTTTTTTTTTTAATRTGPLSPEGRVTKTTARRRSRASRRTPTTLLNTDTTNFRAMVQQFTGGPTTAPNFQTRPTFNFTLGGGGGGGAILGPAAGFNLQYQNQFSHQQQVQINQQAPFMFSSGNVATTGGGGDHGFLQRLAQPLAAEINNVSDSANMVVPPPPTSSNDQSRGNIGNFMF